MPTKLDRVQVLFKKDLFNKLKTIAQIERRSLSGLVGGLVEDAIKTEKYQDLLSKAKTNDINSKIQEGKLLIKDILDSDISNKVNFDANSKLKKLDQLLSLISKSNQIKKEELPPKDFLVDNILEPNTALEEITADTDQKLKRLRNMLTKITNNNDSNV